MSRNSRSNEQVFHLPRTRPEEEFIKGVEQHLQRIQLQSRRRWNDFTELCEAINIYMISERSGLLHILVATILLVYESRQSSRDPYASLPKYGFVKRANEALSVIRNDGLIQQLNYASAAMKDCLNRCSKQFLESVVKPGWLHITHTCVDTLKYSCGHTYTDK